MESNNDFSKFKGLVWLTIVTESLFLFLFLILWIMPSKNIVWFSFGLIFIFNIVFMLFVFIKFHKEYKLIAKTQEIKYLSFLKK